MEDLLYLYDNPYSKSFVSFVDQSELMSEYEICSRIWKLSPSLGEKEISVLPK